MTIDYTKQGLRLGYLIRGKFHDSGGTERTLRLCGPFSRTGTGEQRPDPDDSSTWPTHHYWRSGATGVNLIDDLGKLTQHITIPGQLSITVPISYPADPRSETTATDRDANLREYIITGRWANKDVDLWLIDLDTGDTEHRFRGSWSKDPSTRPGAFDLTARESLGVLGTPWKMTTFPLNPDTVWTDDNVINMAGDAITPDTYEIAPHAKGAKVGCVFGYNDGPSTNTTPAPVWREILWYGSSTGSDESLFFHVSPQYGCGVGVVRFVGDDGTVYESATTMGIGSPLAGHNYDPARGPLGTFVKVPVNTAALNNWTPDEADNKAYARIHGPSDDPTAVEWNATEGEPFTLIGGAAASSSVEEAGELIELLIEDSDYLGASNVLGTGAVSSFTAGNPSAVAEFGEFLCAVPEAVEDSTEMTYREVLSNLVASLGADLVWRYDSTAGERRLYPMWREPTPSTTSADHTIHPFHLVSSQPPSVRHLPDPFGEYANDVKVLAPEYIDQPASLPIADNALLEAKSRNSQRIIDAVEQGGTKAGGEIEGKREWKWWSPHSSATGNEHSRFLAGEVSQPQIWVEAEISGGLAFTMQLADVVQYQIQGITTRFGQVRRLDYDLENQSVTASSIHVEFFADGAEAE